jgi:cell division protein FtsN
MIEKYISELLLTQDKVVVPNLGIFTSTFSPASFSADDESMLTPPRKAVNFSIYIRKEDKNDDLMKIVMRGENMSYYDFNEHLLTFVQQVQQSIVTSNHYSMSGLGTLVKDSSNKIVLRQNDEVSLLGDSFGLPPIDTDKELVANLPIDELKEDRSSSLIFDEKPTATNKPEEIISKEEAGRQEVKEELKEKSTVYIVTDKNEIAQENKKSDLVWWLTVTPLVLLLAFVVYLFTFEEAMQNFKAFFGSQKEVNANLSTDQQATNPIENQVTEDTARFENRTEDSPKVSNQETTQETEITTPSIDNVDTPIKASSDDALTAGKFYLVFGSYSSKQLAQKASKLLENKGLETKIIPLTSKGLFRVVVGDFASHADASNKKAELGSEFSNTWVLKAQ